MCSNKLIHVFFQIDPLKITVTEDVSDQEEKNTSDLNVKNNSFLVDNVSENIDEIKLFNIEQTTANVKTDEVMNIPSLIINFCSIQVPHEKYN